MKYNLIKKEDLHYIVNIDKMFGIYHIPILTHSGIQSGIGYQSSFENLDSINNIINILEDNNGLRFDEYTDREIEILFEFNRLEELKENLEFIKNSCNDLKGEELNGFNS